jgi:hypothetical protein
MHAEGTTIRTDINSILFQILDFHGDNCEKLLFVSCTEIY